MVYSFQSFLCEATTEYVAKKIDPALMTWKEYYDLINPKDKSHPSSAYNWDVSQMQQKKSAFPELLFRRKIHGITFEFRLKKEDRYNYQFVKTDADGMPIRIDGEIQYYTPEELSLMEKFNRYEYSVGVFDGEQEVAVSQDEWGCLLVVVAKEYRDFGLGKMVGKIAMELEPGKNSGGMTPSGYRVSKSIHTEFVREYLRKGYYSLLVRSGILTKEKVKEILASVSGNLHDLEGNQGRKDAHASMNLNLMNRDDWLLYAKDGSFILYNRKLRELLEKNEEEFGYWINRAIFGTSYSGGGYVSTDRLYLHQLGGDTLEIKKFMLMLALSYAKQENLPLHVYNDDLGLLNPKLVKISGNLVELIGEPIDYRGLAMVENRFRSTFDRYDEFRIRLLELAEVKFR